MNITHEHLNGSSSENATARGAYRVILVRQRQRGEETVKLLRAIALFHYPSIDEAVDQRLA